MMFLCVVVSRRFLYRLNILPSYQSTVPVVVVGNIHAGGSGKTPLIAFLSRALSSHLKIVIVSRGYGSLCKVNEPIQVDINRHSASDVGDEALMLAQNTNVSVIVCTHRVRAVRWVEQHIPNVDLLLLDDGLQHYAIQRNIEIAVIPSTLYLGHRFLLPSGPLREPYSRLSDVSAVVFNAPESISSDEKCCYIESHIPENIARFCMKHTLGKFYRLDGSNETWDEQNNKHLVVSVLTAIAKPQRFLAALLSKGISLGKCVIRPDHAPLSVSDLLELEEADCIIVTEKDAVKLKTEPVDPRIWVAPLLTEVSPNIDTWLIHQLRFLSASSI
jgi:tetraacyldisaccharide 4'-kinase